MVREHFQNGGTPVRLVITTICFVFLIFLLTIKTIPVVELRNGGDGLIKAVISMYTVDTKQTLHSM